MRWRSAVVGLFASVASMPACGPSRDRAGAILPVETSEVCAAQPWVLDLTTRRGMSLNHEPLDSAQLRHWISVYMVQRPANRRYVVIRSRSDERERDATWIAAAVAERHGKAFRDSGDCHLEVPSV